MNEWTCTSHYAACMNVIIAENMRSLIVQEDRVRRVWEISMDAFVVTMHVVVVAGGIRGFIQILSCIWVVLAIIRARPELSLPSSSSHSLEHLSLIHVPSHSHFLFVHVDVQVINPWKIHKEASITGLHNDNDHEYLMGVLFLLPDSLEIALRILFSHPSQSIWTRSSTICQIRRRWTNVDPLSEYPAEEKNGKHHLQTWHWTIYSFPNADQTWGINFEMGWSTQARRRRRESCILEFEVGWAAVTGWGLFMEKSWLACARSWMILIN